MSFQVEDFTMRLHRKGHPVITYVLQDQDTADAGGVGTEHYYGYVTTSGEWMIMERVIGTAGSSRFVFGRSDYATAWADRDNKTYKTLDLADVSA